MPLQKRARVQGPQAFQVLTSGDNSVSGDLFDRVLGPVFQVTLNGVDLGEPSNRQPGRRITNFTSPRNQRGRGGRGRGRGGRGRGRGRGRARSPGRGRRGRGGRGGRGRRNAGRRR